jgi:hypothetical protein
MRLLSTLSFVFLFAACPQNMVRDAGLPADAGVSDFVGRACNVDAECGALRCDKVRRQCICLSDESCNTDMNVAPRFCNNYTGLCVTEITGCKGDANCGATEWCDPSIRTCRPLKSFCEPCAADRECGGQKDNCIADPNLNNQKFCGTSCVDDATCPRGAKCQDKNGSKQCWPDKTAFGLTATCNDFVVCTPDSLRSCNASADCQEASQRCDTTKGKCVAIARVCSAGTSCDTRLKLCVTECLQDADCGGGNLRCNNRVCEPKNDCVNDTECTGTRVCTIAPGQTVGECRNQCEKDVECPLGQKCAASGTKLSCQPGCANNSGCGLDQRCKNGLCEGPVVGTDRICQATNACSTCQSCQGTTNTCINAKTVFPHCQTCSSPADCSGGACVQLLDGLSYCARGCTAGQECPQGFACLTLSTGNQACIPADRSCIGKCP